VGFLAAVLKNVKPFFNRKPSSFKRFPTPSSNPFPPQSRAFVYLYIYIFSAISILLDNSPKEKVLTKKGEKHESQGKLQCNKKGIYNNF